MSLNAGTRLGPYEITARIGAGGMGEVYKGRDTRLGRDVAIKVLPEHLALNTELRERFQREAETIANLKHPNICTLYDIGEQAGTQYLVMEYLEGETLAERLQKGPLPLEQGFKVAIEISDALDKAHRKGATHRDIKPANIMLTKEGSQTVSKLLDFGLAKLKQQAGAPVVPFSQMPTVAPGERAAASPGHGETAQGTILGTVQYMSPEQVEGRIDDIDGRSDIFSFGATVYEMLTGQKAFEGKSQASVMAKILEHDPPAVSQTQAASHPGGLPPEKLSPPVLDRVVKKCLAKDPDDRWQSARDLHDELEWIKNAGGQVGLPAASAPHFRFRERLAWFVAVVFLATTAVASILLYLRQATSPSGQPIRFSISAPEKSLYSWYPSVEISPDGTQVAFVAVTEGKQMLWVRPLDSLDARPLPGTEGAGFPFWSPDSQYLGYFSGPKLYTIAVSGGVPTALSDASFAFTGGTWSRDGTIVFGRRGSLARVPAAGGEPTPVTALDPAKQETFHTRPHFLPDGHHFLYLAISAVHENYAVYVASLDSKETKRLFASGTEARYVPPGYLLYGRQGVLMAQRFDPDRLELSGEAFRVADAVHYDTEDGTLDASVSANGVLAYRGGNLSTRLVWIDRTGRELSSAGPPGAYLNLSLSPDDQRVLFDRFDPQSGNRDLWLYDLARGAASRFTFDPADDSDAVWSPDGQRVVFASNRGKRGGLYQKLVSGAGQEEPLVTSDAVSYPRDWSTDERFLVYESWVLGGNSDLWMLPLFGDRKPSPILQTEFPEREGRLSPDGRWIAFDSSESGKREVYVQSFPAAGGKIQISTAGGFNPRWRRDGKEIFFIAEDGQMTAAPVSANTRFEAGMPKPLFRALFPGWTVGGIEHYSVSSDGQRFLLNVPSEDAFSPITVVLNWTAALKKGN
jgi:eukaryotic-like serine/threonine-protein kinase